MDLQKVLSVLGEGDALVLTHRDCPGRSLRDLANIAHEIEQAGRPELKSLLPCSRGRTLFHELSDVGLLTRKSQGKHL
jgi:hypothetical protein